MTKNLGFARTVATAIVFACVGAAGSKADDLPPQSEWLRVAQTADGFLNMRTGPGASYAIVARIPSGTSGIRRGECKASDGGRNRAYWCWVQWRDKQGWVSARFVEADFSLSIPGSGIDVQGSIRPRNSHQSRVIPHTPQIGSCHMGSCSWGTLLNFSSPVETREGLLFGVEVLGGESSHADVSEYPDAYSPSLDIEWNRKSHNVNVLCSLNEPSVIIGNQITTLDFNSVDHVEEPDANLYVSVCHGDLSYSWMRPGWAQENGYR